MLDFDDLIDVFATLAGLVYLTVEFGCKLLNAI